MAIVWTKYFVQNMTNQLQRYTWKAWEQKNIKKSNLQFNEKDKKNNIFPCKNLKTTKFKKYKFSRHYFHDQNVEKHKKDKIEILSFP